MRSKTHIMMLASCHRIGGFETKLDCLIRHMNRNKFRITVLLIYPYYKAKQVPQNVRNQQKAYLSWEGITNIELCMKYRFDFSIVWQAIRILKKNKVDLLYFLALGSGTFIAPIAGYAAGIPSTVRAGDTVLKGLYPRILRWIDKILVSKTDVIIVPASFLKQYYVEKLKINPDKIKVVPNSIDLNVFGRTEKNSTLKQELGIGKHSKIIGIIANLLPVKDHSVLFHAMPKIIKKFPQTTVLLVGEGPLKRELEELAKLLGIFQNVKFLGYRTDVPELIPLFDIGILCSRMEIHPNSLLEIMASGIPVIASSVGGIPEIIQDRKDGIVVKQGDSVELADVILKLLQKPQYAKKLGRNGREKVFTHFSTEKMIRSTETVFDSISG